MQKKTKAGSGKTKNTHVAIIIQNHDAPDQQQAELRALAKKLAPEFLAKIGAVGKQFEVAVSNKY